MLNQRRTHPASFSRLEDPAIGLTSVEAGLIVYYLLFWPRRGWGREEWGNGNGTSLVTGYLSTACEALLSAV